MNPPRTNLESGKVLQYAWDSFRKDLIHPEAGDVQVNEQKKSFYAGALVVLTAALQIAEQDLPDDRGTAVMHSLWKECENFAMNLPDNGPGGLSDQEVKPGPSRQPH